MPTLELLADIETLKARLAECENALTDMGSERDNQIAHSDALASRLAEAEALLREWERDATARGGMSSVTGRQLRRRIGTTRAFLEASK